VFCSLHPSSGTVFLKQLLDDSSNIKPIIVPVAKNERAWRDPEKQMSCLDGSRSTSVMDDDGETENALITLQSA
jgi:hypothetical protein